jgi:hypothetical protein
VAANQPQLATILLNRRPSLDDDVALAVLAQAIRHNLVDVVQYLLANEHLDTSRRAFDAPTALVRREPLQPLAVEVAVDYGRYDVLEQLMRRREFQPSVDNNALLRALCGIDGRVVGVNRAQGLVLFRYSSLCESRAAPVTKPVRDSEKVTTFVRRLLLDERFEPAGQYGALSNIFQELCGQERLIKMRPMHMLHITRVVAPPASATETSKAVAECYSTSGGGRTMRDTLFESISRAQLVRLLLEHPVCDPNAVDITRSGLDASVKLLLESDARFARAPSTIGRGPGYRLRFED